MSQAKTVKPKKKFDFEKLRIYFRALFKNDAVKEIGMTKSIYIGAIAALLAVAVSIIPLVVHTAGQKGSDFLSASTVYNFDEGFYAFLKDAKDKGCDITFNHNDHTASLNGATTDPAKNYLLYEHIYESKDGHDVKRKDMQVYFVPKGVDFNTAFTTIGAENTNSTNGRDTSYIIFGYEAFAAATYKYGTYKFVSGVSGNYKAVSEKYNKVSDFYITSEPTYIANVNASVEKFKPFLDETYKQGKTQLTMMQAGIGYALNGGITLLMGFILWLLTRGKNNPNRSVKLSQTMNMAFWATITPALISLLLGFILHNASYDLMIYVVCFGFRSMWLSMKQMPSYQQ